MPDHNVPTTLDRANAATMTEDSRVQVAALDTNAKEFGLHYYPVSDVRQGIVHIVGPEQGWTLPGMTVVCGDSHTATHGAFGSLAHGIGTSEVEHVLATQTLIQKKSKNMKVEITGTLSPGVTAKDIVLTIIGETGTGGGTGYVIEYCGDAIRELSMEGRMTICNMCLAMNPDQLSEGERCASTSNRNFEGRQGYKGRTHLVSPAMAAAAAVTGKLTDIREL